MLKSGAVVLLCLAVACASTAKKSPLVVKTVLPNSLKEISGVIAVGDAIWAITDKPKARVFRLDATGKLLQTVNISNMEAVDVEAVTSDNTFIYIGDVGDNVGDRIDRRIIRVRITDIPKGTEVQVRGEAIDFSFPNEEVVEKKKQNNFDCESMLSYKDSLYLFTKDREDKETRLYAVPRDPGRYMARYISSFDSRGLVTDAALNQQKDELALIGYHKGHLYPFILLFTNFTGDDFFSGDHQRIELAKKEWDWQLEGITYSNNNIVYFTCEETKQVPATFYGIRREDLFKLNKKKKEKNSEDDGQSNEGDEPGLTKKGHLKM